MPHSSAVNDKDIVPVITRYPWQRRRDYLMLVAAVASSDDVLHPDELVLLKRWMDQFELGPKSRERVLAVANHAPVDVAAIQKRLEGTELTYSLMLDLMGMAMADGILKDKEIRLLRGTARALDVDPIHFTILIEFTHAAHQASLLSNPEPLYEHNIISAFTLLKEQNVCLFPHTLLCVASQKYDEELKLRWFRFLADGR